MQVSSSEYGLVRLFSVDLPCNQIETFRTRSFDGEDNQTSWPLGEALGATDIDEDFIDLFDVADLDSLGLTGFMVQGLGIAEQDIARDKALLGAISGRILIITSAAFRGVAQDLTPKAPLRWIGTYTEAKPLVHFAPLPDAGAKGVLASDASSIPANPHLTLMWAILALPILALAIGAVIFGVTR